MRRLHLLELLDEAEVEHLHVVDVTTLSAQEDVRRLDVPVNETGVVRFGEGMAHLAHDVDDPGWWHRAVLLDQTVQVLSIQQFHHVVEGPVRRDAVVVDLDRVR